MCIVRFCRYLAAISCFITCFNNCHAMKRAAAFMGGGSICTESMSYADTQERPHRMYGVSLLINGWKQTVLGSSISIIRSSDNFSSYIDNDNYPSIELKKNNDLYDGMLDAMSTLSTTGQFATVKWAYTHPVKKTETNILRREFSLGLSTTIDMMHDNTFCMHTYIKCGHIAGCWASYGKKENPFSEIRLTRQDATTVDMTINGSSNATIHSKPSGYVIFYGTGFIGAGIHATCNGSGYILDVDVNIATAPSLWVTTSGVECFISDQDGIDINLPADNKASLPKLFQNKGVYNIEGTNSIKNYICEKNNLNPSLLLSAHGKIGLYLSKTWLLFLHIELFHWEKSNICSHTIFPNDTAWSILLEVGIV